jgi:hypothetical protein
VTTSIFRAEPLRARELVFRIPDQALRDAALGELLLSQAAADTVERELLPLIRDDQSRQQTAYRVAELLASNSNNELANQIAGAFISDVALRQEVLRRIASGDTVDDPLLEIQRAGRTRRGGADE